MVGQLAARRAAGIVLEMVKVRGVGREGGREGRCGLSVGRQDRRKRSYDSWPARNWKDSHCYGLVTSSLTC